MILYIDKEQDSQGGEVYEGETGPYASHEPKYITTTFTRASFTSDRMFYETIDVSDSLAREIKKAGKVYLAVIFYADGDTFGTTYGYFQLSGVSATLAGAEKQNKKALSGKGYKPWEGYFSRLIGAEIFELPLT